MRTFVLVLAAMIGPTTVSAADTAAPHWRIDTAASAVTYTVDHSMHRVIGTSRSLRGEFAWDPAVTAPAAIRGTYIQADWASFDSGNASRDSNLLQIVDAVHYPTLTFLLESLNRGPDGMAQVDGWLYVKGKRVRLSAPASVQVREGGHLVGATRMTAKLTDFAIEPPSLLFVPVQDTFAIDVHLVATRIPAD